MKRFFAAVLISMFMLSVFTVPCFAEGEYETVKIESVFLKNVDLKASDWYDSEEFRALFCATAAMEVILLEKEEYTNVLLEAMVSGNCYMSKKGLSVSAYFYAEEQLVVVLYQPVTKTLEAGILNLSALGYTDTLMNSLVEKGDIDSFYAVNSEDIITMIQLALKEAQ